MANRPNKEMFVIGPRLHPPSPTHFITYKYTHPLLPHHSTRMLIGVGFWDSTIGSNEIPPPLPTIKMISQYKIIVWGVLKLSTACLPQNFLYLHFDHTKITKYLTSWMHGCTELNYFNFLFIMRDNFLQFFEPTMF